MLPHLRRALGRLAFRIARSRGGAALAALAVIYAPWALPVRRHFTTATVVAFRHPLPEVRDHAVLVPRRRAPTLCSFVDTAGPEAFRALLLAAELVAAMLPPQERVLLVNVGVRQDVAQLHAHILPASGARTVLDEADPPIEVPRDDAVALARALQAIIERLGGCDASVDGSLLISPLGGDAWRVAASVAT